MKWFIITFTIVILVDLWLIYNFWKNFTTLPNSTTSSIPDDIITENVSSSVYEGNVHLEPSNSRCGTTKI